MRVVLTGGPHAGKTTLLRALADAGARVVPESALVEIAELVRELGVDGARAFRRANMAEFQRRVAVRQVRVEAELGELSGERVFFDRGVIDGLAYCEHNAVAAPDDLTHASARARYDLVVVCELVLPFAERAGSGRISDEDAARRLEGLIESAYRARGVRTARLAVAPFEDRLAALERLVADAAPR